MLITGTWSDVGGTYAVVFDSCLTVTGYTIQPGVIRCFCPRKFFFTYFCILVFTVFFVFSSFASQCKSGNRSQRSTDLRSSPI